MNLLNTSAIPTFECPSAVALGLFDGLHRGHRAVIERAVAYSPALLPTVFTFEFDDPAHATKPTNSRILSPTRKRRILAELGVSAVCELPFSTFRDLSPEDFFAEILQKHLRTKAVFCGYDYRFGRNAAGDAALLGTLCKQAAVHFEAVPALMQNGEPISSTRIRALLRAGEMEEAADLLGECYAIDFPVAHGRQLGRQMGYPTINQLYPPGDLLPRFGVYATRATIGGTTYPGVTNVGVKPTIAGENAPSAETYLIGYDGDLYGQRVPLAFVTFLRPEQRFSSVEALFSQIAADAVNAKLRLV